MPLRAYIEDKEIVSIDLNDEEWSALKARLKAKEIVLTLPCCGQEGFLRTSNRGLKHFVPDPVFKFFSLPALRVDPLDKTVYLGSGEHKTAPEVEPGELTADAVTAQLTVADLQQVADLAHFKDRRTAKHIPVTFHIGDIFADLSDDFQNLIESFHNRVAVGFRRKDAMTE